MEVLVAGEGDQGAKGNADRVEDLGGGVDDSCDSLYDSLVTAYLGGGVHPDLGSEHPAPVRGEEDPEARGQYVAENPEEKLTF